MRVDLSVSIWVSMRMRIRIKIRAAYAPAFGIPRAGVDVSDSVTKRPFRSVCKMVCCKGFPAYVI